MTQVTPMSPRRFGAMPRAELQGGGAAQLLSGSSSPNNSNSVLASRLTRKEMNEPLGHSPIRNSGAARFGIVLPPSPSAPRIAGMSTPRGESVSQLLQQSAPSSGRTAATTTTHMSSSPTSARTSARGQNDVIHSMAGGEVSPRAAAQQSARATTFTALPGGPEKASTFRFGHVVQSLDTAQSIISPRAGSDNSPASVVPSPERTRSKRFGNHTHGLAIIGECHTRADPAQLPPACLPTREGMEMKAALPSVHARDSVKEIMDACGSCQDDGLKASAGKVTSRGVPEMDKGRLIPVVGMPTVRAELSPPSRRKLTDSRNYGDEPSARQLVNEADNTTVAAMLTAKNLSSPGEAVAWSNRCMWGISPADARRAFDFAQEQSGSGARISLQDLKNAVNKLY